jgi:hypothetical protein
VRKGPAARVAADYSGGDSRQGLAGVRVAPGIEKWRLRWVAAGRASLGLDQQSRHGSEDGETAMIREKRVEATNR